MKPAGLDSTLWYERPARILLTEGLPVGNGSLGALLAGDPHVERISLSEKCLWSGGPGEFPGWKFGIPLSAPEGADEGARTRVEAVRSLVADGREAEALRLSNRTLAGDPSGYGSNEVLGHLSIAMAPAGVAAARRTDLLDYRRSLDPLTGIHEASWSRGQGQDRSAWSVEAFCSFPDQVLAWRLRCGAAADFEVAWEQARQGRDWRHLYPEVLAKVQAPATGREESARETAWGFLVEGCLRSNGLRYSVAVAAVPGAISMGTEASFSATGASLRGAKDILVLAAAAVERPSPGWSPPRDGEERQSRADTLRAIVTGRIEAALALGAEGLRRRHVEDVSGLMGRCSLELGGESAGRRRALPTDRRLARARRAADPGLAALLFDYGRYLLVASSRPGCLPAHLQGAWNDAATPPWSADYHLNINLQMNYWPAEAANLPECAAPLVDYTLGLVGPGRRVARAFYGTRGWVAETCTTPWGWVAPGWTTTWGHFPGGAAWLCRHLWERYEYSLDLDWLREKAWPAMREAALFWLDWLVEDGKGRLVSSPSYSPEHGPFRAGASMDRQLAADLLGNCLKAAGLLGLGGPELDAMRDTLNRIAGPEIGRLGQLKEWLEDLDSPRDRHRHVSHAYALHPGEAIDPARTPDLAAALSKSLDFRGDGGTGWSLAWKINLRARLGQGARAGRLLGRMTRPVRSRRTNYGEAGGFYANLFCAHPPFQIDGNFGAAAGILECLVQSQGGVVRLLPALPPAWPEGRLSGARLRGDATLSLAWREGRLVSALLEPRRDGSFLVRHGALERRIEARAGIPVALDANLDLVPPGD